MYVLTLIVLERLTSLKIQVSPTHQLWTSLGLKHEELNIHCMYISILQYALRNIEFFVNTF